MIIQHARDLLAMLTGGGVKNCNAMHTTVCSHVNLNSQNFIVLPKYQCIILQRIASACDF